jgi:hypothetical protein
MPVTKRKATGAHFTPPDLARLVAERVAALIGGFKGALRVLDPACGDGNLLCAINDALPRDVRRRVTLVGIENDEASFASLRARQQSFDGCKTDLIRGDFLEFLATTIFLAHTKNCSRSIASSPIRPTCERRCSARSARKNSRRGSA